MVVEYHGHFDGRRLVTEAEAPWQFINAGKIRAVLHAYPDTRSQASPRSIRPQRNQALEAAVEKLIEPIAQLVEFRAKGRIE
jgi:hypothetical protein